MLAKRLQRCFGFVLVWLCLLALGSPALAQGAVPVQVGQNATGVIAPGATTAQFALTSTGSGTVQIQVLAISSGYIPNFRVLNPAGVDALSVSNPNAQAILSGNLALNDTGVYTIVVGGENGTTGQFVLSLQAGAALPAPVTLTVEQPIIASVGSVAPVQVYRFDTTSLGAINLKVVSQTPGAGALVTLVDESVGKTIASSDAGVVGVTYQLPATGKTYRVEVRAGSAGDTLFSICIGTCGDSPAAPAPNVPPPAVTQEVSAACTATSSAGGSVNLRSGPGTQYAALSSLPFGQTAQVTGVWTGGGWYVVNFVGQTFWVGSTVVSLTGACSALPGVPTPTNAPLAPTATPANPPPPVNTPEVEPPDNSSQQLSDLTPINVRISNPGDGTLSIDITVYNGGSAPVASPYAVKTCLDNTTCNEITGFAAGLQPGETMSFTDALPFPGGGSHSITVTVDSQNEEAESNEGNNSAFSSFNL